MSKTKKLFTNPRAFFRDAIRKRLTRGGSANQGNINQKPPIKPAALLLQKAQPISKYRDQLLTLKRNAAVNFIKYNDAEHLWPAVRFAIWRGLRQAWETKKKTKIVPLITRLSNDWYDVYQREYGCIPISSLENDQLDFLFFSNFRGVEQTTIDGKIYNRITDPVFEAANRIGRAKKIEIVKGPGGINLHRFNETTFVLPTPLRTVGHMNLLKIPSTFHAEITRHIPSIQYKPEDLNDVIEWHFRDKEIYLEVLKKLRPKFVFFIGFEFHLALCSAASELGIKSVDLQHGLQTGWGPLYKWWEEMPPSGYTLLPDYFAVWGERDKAHLESQLICHSQRHKVVVSGYPWLKKQLELGKDLSERTVSLIESYSLVVLISMQHQREVPEEISALISFSEAEVRNNVLWVIRKHPKGRAIPKKGVFAQKNVLISDEIDSVPLAALLKRVHAHVTSSSTVVIEADHFGVPSFIIDGADETGYENYEKEIDEGTVHLLSTPADFFTALKELEPSPRNSKIDAISDVNIEALLASFLNESSTGLETLMR